MGGVAALAFGAEALGTEAAVVGAEALGAGALEAGTLGAEALGAGALGAEAAGAGALGAEALGAGALGAEALGAAELAAAGVEGLAAPAAAGLGEVGAGIAEAGAGALAPEAGALASAASPAVSGLSTVAGEALPVSIAEGAGVAPLTETALDFSLPASTEAGINAGIEEATAQGATQAATQGATQGLGQAATQVADLGTTTLPEQGIGSNLASQSMTSEAFNSSLENTASQLEQGAKVADASAQTVPPPTSTAPPAVQPMNPPAPPAPGLDTARSFLDPSMSQAAQQLSATPAAPLAPVESASSALAPASKIPEVIDLTSGSAATQAAAQAGGEGLADKAGSFLSKNASSILSALGLAANMAKGQQPPKYSGNLQAQADAMNARGAQLQGYLTSGTLPPGIGDALAGAHDSAAASIRGRYAKMGMSGSSAEMQDLNNLAQTTVSQGADIANKLLATGVSQQQFAAGLYQNLMATSMQQDTNMSNAIAGFTNAMAKASAVGP